MNLIVSLVHSNVLWDFQNDGENAKHMKSSAEYLNDCLLSLNCKLKNQAMFLHVDELDEASFTVMLLKQIFSYEPIAMVAWNQ
jgi:hypothetical protein